MASPRMWLQLASSLPCRLLIPSRPGSSEGPSPSTPGWIILLPSFKEVLTPSIPRDWLMSKMIQLAWSLAKASLSDCGCVSPVKGAVPHAFRVPAEEHILFLKLQSSELFEELQENDKQPHPRVPRSPLLSFLCSLLRSSVSTRWFTFWNMWPYSLQGWGGNWLKNKVVKNKTLTSISTVVIITDWAGLGFFSVHTG